MEWIFLYNVLIMFSVEQVISLPEGVCGEYRSIDSSIANQTVLVAFCFNYFNKRNGVCVACPNGYKSNGENCTPCLDGQYGRKCAETCSCYRTERCDHVRGCIPIDDKTEKNAKTTQSDGQSNGQDADITIREIILFVVITSFGLLIVGGLVYMYLKRQTRIQIPQNQHNEIIADNSRNDMHLQLSEEGNNSVYDIIDESAMSKTLEPFTFRTQNPYLDVMYGPNTPMNVKDNLGISCLPGISSLSQPVQMTNLRSQRCGLEESVIIHQGALLSAYSDGYLRPRSFEHYTGINKMMTKQGALFSKTNSMTQKEYGRHIYDVPAYDIIGRDGNYDRLIFSKDNSNLRNEKETKQIGINIKPPKYTTCSPKRNTV